MGDIQEVGKKIKGKTQQVKGIWNEENADARLKDKRKR